MLKGVLPPADGEILCASARHILRQHLKLPRLRGIQTEVNPHPYCAGAVHVAVALDYHCPEDAEPLCVTAALLEPKPFYCIDLHIFYRYSKL